jgi:drug/metabolite transporter (DMT)-like permease
VTVVAVLIGAILLHERFSTMQVVGTFSIVCGCALVLELVPWRRAYAA